MNDNESLDTATLLHALSRNVLRSAQDHPLLTVAGAAGVGLVLARGLPNAALRFGTGLAMRAASARLMANVSELAQDIDATTR